MISFGAKSLAPYRDHRAVIRFSPHQGQRNSRSSRLGNPEDTAAQPGALVNPAWSSFLFYRRKIGCGVPGTLRDGGMVAVAVEQRDGGLGHAAARFPA